MASDTSDGAGIPESTAGAAVVRTKPTKPLPTDRVGLDKQFFILRAVAKASLASNREAVANADVAKIADIHPSSVSICNPFWNDIGLVNREGLKQQPTEAVFEYDQAADWNAEKAPLKLGRVIEGTWFARAILPRLALRSMSRSEVVEQLAEEIKAPKEYKPQLELLIDYMRMTGVVAVDGNTVSRTAKAEEPPKPPIQPPPLPDNDRQPERSNGGGQRQPPRSNVKRIAIALPDKDEVIVELPEGFDRDDWILVADHLAGYIRRWKKFQMTQPLREALVDDDDTSTSQPGEKP